MKQSFLIATLAVVFSTGCHKSNTKGTTPSPCKLISATSNNQGWITNYSFSYDSKDRLTTVQASGSGNPYTETLSYGDNYIATSTDFSGTPGTRDTVFLDAGGNVSSISIWGTGSGKTTITYTRDSQGNPTQSTSVSSNGTTTTTSYQYTNGDLMGGSSMGDAFTYGYYTDKPSAINDAQAMQQFLTYGVIAYKSAHLCKSFQAATISQTYTYTMDDKGNITQMIAVNAITGKTVSTTQYTYQCN